MNLVFLDDPAETIDICNAGHGAQRGAYHPILQDAHILYRHVGGRIQHVTIDLADRVGEGRDTGLDAVGQRDVLQFFQHLLAGEIIVGVIGEGQRDDGQAGDGDRTQLDHARHAAHLALDGQGHIAFDLFRGQTQTLGDDLHLHILHIGEGFDRQIFPGVPAKDDQHQAGTENEYALLQRKGDEFV